MNEEDYTKLLDAQPIGTVWISDLECAIKRDNTLEGWWLYPSSINASKPKAVGTDSIAFVMQNVRWNLS